MAASRVSVFLTMAYDVSLPSAVRSAVTCLTDKPRYSVSTAAVEVRKASVSAATAAALSGRTVARRCSASTCCEAGCAVSVAMGLLQESG